MGGSIGLWWLTMDVWIGKNHGGHGSGSSCYLAWDA